MEPPKTTEKGDYYDDFTKTFLLEVIEEPFRSNIRRVKDNIRGMRKPVAGLAYQSVNCRYWKTLLMVSLLLNKCSLFSGCLDSQLKNRRGNLLKLRPKPSPKQTSMSNESCFGFQATAISCKIYASVSNRNRWSSLAQSRSSLWKTD